MPTTTADAPPATGSDRTARRDLVGLAVATVLLRIPAYLAESHPTFDDGVFGASAVAMRAGGQPFRDVFSSQGPLFLPLVWLGDLLGFRTWNSPRIVSIAAGVLLVVVVYLAGRQVADRTGALVAAGLTSGCASVLWISGPISADIPAVAFASLTMLLLLRWRDDLSVRRAVLLGLTISATISVKALLAPVILPVALALLVGRRLLPIVAGAVTAVGTHLLLWLPWGPSNVWDQAYGYHLEVAGDRTPGANLAKLSSTLGDRDLPLVLALLAAVAAIALGRRALQHAEPRSLRSPDVLVLAWVGTTVLVLLTEHPMWRPHVAHLVPGLALLAARHRPPTKALVALGVLVLPYHLVHAAGILVPDGYTASTQEVVDRIATLPDGAKAISDDPGIVWRAGRRTTDDLVDASILRIETGHLTSASIAEVAAQDDVCAVAVRSRVRWGSFGDLPEQLAVEGYEVVVEGPAQQRLYVKADCRPSS